MQYEIIYRETRIDEMRRVIVTADSKAEAILKLQRKQSAEIKSIKEV